MVPGIDEPVDDIEIARSIALQIGFPVLVKASAGGGGKGMRLVYSESELEEQMNMAISEAKSAFGDGSVFIEKFVTNPRHIEIQIMGDQHGNIVYLFERECSIQRRHQKVVEEAPSAVVSPTMRKAMGEAAVKVAKSVNYYGAGTVEFIVDGNLNFYFLEMNTRLQVEHPVTEMITGVDLVREQIRVAQGEKLSFTQDDLTLQGHAMELRVYAEDPQNNFLPDIGLLERYRPPHGSGIRVDDGMEEGMEIPIYYDPMIAKLVTYGKNRTEAIEKMKDAIREYEVVGVKTTLPFGTFVMNHPAFISGNFDTNFVQNYFHPNQIDLEETKMAALLATMLFENTHHQITVSEPGNQTRRSKWKTKRL
jgi:acetyl/propionyl-CoA carboxylase alpha subunit